MTEKKTIESEIITIKKMEQSLSEEEEANREQQKNSQNIIDNLLHNFGNSATAKRIARLNLNINNDHEQLMREINNEKEECRQTLRKLNQEKIEFENMKEE